MRSTSMQSNVSTASVTCTILPPAAVAALWRGQVVEAITLVGVEQNIGLKEAKEHVEAYVHTQPVLRSRLVEAHADTQEGLFRWVIFFLVGGAGLLFFLV